MASISYRCNLSAKSFPLLARNQSRTVIVPGNDQAYTRYGSVAERLRDVNTPQAYYMENVLPTLEGYKAVGYKTFTMSFAGGSGLPAGVYALRVESIVVGGILSGILEASNGTFYLINQGDANTFFVSAVHTGDTVPNYRDDAVTYAQVNGDTYVLMYDGSVNTKFAIVTGASMTDIIPTGLSLVDTKGITASNGYCIAYSDLAVAWSSLVDPTDFVPSLITGAGGGSIQEINGRIKFCVPTSFGFIVFAEKNAVAATYTGNSRNPFKFTAIKGSGGGVSLNLVAKDYGAQNVLAWTTKGFQQVGPVVAENVFPELTEFVYTKYKETFDVTAATFTNSVSTRRLGRLSYISNRYVVYSFNNVSTSEDVIEFTNAFVFDKVLERWGHVELNHVSVVNFFDYLLIGSGTPFYALSTSFFNFAAPLFFVNSTGQVYQFGDRYTDFSGGSSAIILGKFQYVRAKRLCLDKVNIENSGQTFDSTSITCIDLPTQEDATNESPVSGTVFSSRSTFKVFHFNVDAIAHSLLITGGFNLTNVELEFHPTGNT